MSKNAIIPELKVLEYNKSLDFYTRLAGFQILYERSENNFTLLDIYGACLMIEGFKDKKVALG
jgi:hypothetical protein